jgi:hypothetical protein
LSACTTHLKSKEASNHETDPNICISFVFLSLLATPAAVASGKKIHVILAVDVSSSNPIIPREQTPESLKLAKNYAEDVAGLVQKRLDAIKLTADSIVEWRTFGERNPTKQINKSVIVSRKNRPDNVKTALLRQVLRFPEMVQKGLIEPQEATNIASTLFSMADRVNCKEYDLYVLIITDGIEASEYGHTPPTPRPGIFENCTKIDFLGLWAPTDAETQILKKDWQDFGRASGFRDADTVSALN